MDHFGGVAVSVKETSICISLGVERTCRSSAGHFRLWHFSDVPGQPDDVCS
jgi:hypothetical protein